jgi:hypothetical protein
LLVRQISILLREQLGYQNQAKRFLVHIFLRPAVAKASIKQSLPLVPVRVRRLLVRSVAIMRAKRCLLR